MYSVTLFCYVDENNDLMLETAAGTIGESKLKLFRTFPYLYYDDKDFVAFENYMKKDKGSFITIEVRSEEFFKEVY